MGAVKSSTALVQEQLAALAQRYVEQLPEKVAEMRALRQVLLSAGWDQVRGDSLHRMAHSLVGSGGSMGLHQVSHAARQLEQIFKGVVQGELAWSAAQAKIDVGLDRLSDAIGLQEPANVWNVSGVMSAVEIAPIKPLNILVVDDDPVGRALLVTLLMADGHKVITANDGLEAVAQFSASQPDIVFMDVIMPRLNGYEASRQIKAACGKQFVPLIFLTALQDANDLAGCIAAGGDDFIVKPYNSVLLKAKLIAMQRIRTLHQELAVYQQRTAEEIELSTHVFNAITNRNPEIAAVRHWYSAVGHFSGDILLYAQTPSGRLLLMLGDFTGHGLGAALAAVPVSDIFYSLVAEDITLCDLALAINRKLKKVMPVGRFCAALLIDINADGTRAEIWNGGIPGAYLLDSRGVIQKRITSSKLPLGVIGDQGFDAKPESVMLGNDTQIFFFTDGVNEARNPQGEMLTTAGAEKMFGSEDAFSALQAGVARHLDGYKADDDISIVAIACDKVKVGRMQ